MHISLFYTFIPEVQIRTYSSAFDLVCSGKLELWFICLVKLGPINRIHIVVQRAYWWAYTMTFEMYLSAWDV